MDAEVESRRGVEQIAAYASTAREGGRALTATTTPVGPGTAQASSSPRGGARRKAAVLLAAVVGVAGLVIWLYAVSIHANQGDSDGATVILEGQALVHGHLLLQGWALSLDSFWAVDALIYAVAVAIDGLRPSLLYAGPAIIATLVIIVGILMARENRRGAAVVAGACAVVALLAFPTHAMAAFFLRGPLHVGTALWALVAFGAIRRGRFGLGWVVAVLLCGAGLLGDFQMLAYGVAPLALAGVVAMLRLRSWRGGIAQVSAAVVSAVIGEVGPKVVTALGGFTIGATNPRASVHALLRNAKHVVTYGFQLLGVRNVRVGPGYSQVFSDPGVPVWFRYVHMIALAVIIVAFLTALLSLLRGVITGRAPVDEPGARSAGSSSAGLATEGSNAGLATDGSRAAEPPASATTYGRAARDRATERWRLDDMLVIATFAPAAVYCALALTSDPEYTRYLTAGVIFASILTGRVVAQYWPKLRPGWLAQGVAAVGVATALCLAATTAYTLSQAEPVQPDGQLVAWLAVHHLRNGVGSYWSASISTVESKGTVTIRPVVASTDGAIGRYPKQSDKSWYSGQHFQFFVWNVAAPWGNDDTASATKTWGVPEHIYSVGTYRVLVWPQSLVVSPNP